MLGHQRQHHVKNGLKQALPALQRGYTQRTRHLAVQASSQTVPVTIKVTKKVEYGESVRLVGNQPFLGNWEPSKAAVMSWTDGHVWQATVDVPIGVDVAFKIVRTKKDGSSAWESGGDRQFKALGPEFGLVVSCDWDATSSTDIKAVPVKDVSRATPAPSAQAAAHVNGQGQSKSNVAVADRPPTPSPGGSMPLTSSTDALSSMEEAARATSAWVGAEPQFVRSRQDRSDRQGTWSTEGLSGVEVDLVKGDHKAGNWLGKLALMKQLLVDRPARMRPTVDELAACYVYATWINTGAIQCVESGGHHRPNHHANAAVQMFRSLEWVIGDAAAGIAASKEAAEAAIVAARQMHKRLPSISGEFRVSTPLTRIRDIAHRNDIPQELKNEIKHTLQNKLHRNAGPEDLVATEAMLARVSAKDGQYPAAFVEEFRIFTRELREFFNASGLIELLDSTFSSMDDGHKAVTSQFRSAMQAIDVSTGNGNGSGEPSMDDLMAALFMGTQARGYFASGLSAGLRNDIGDDVLAIRQRWRLAEIRIEEYIFVLLSRITNQLEKAGAPGILSRPGSAPSWRVAMGALINGLRQLGLSGYATRELLALDNELEAWLNAWTRSALPPNDPAQIELALRGKASVERALRLAGQYSDILMEVYVGPADRLGKSLGVPPHMAKIFGEAEVRASVAFQVSRLASMASKALRAAAGLDAWDPLVTGTSTGRLVAVDSITPESMDAACKGHNDNVILLAKQADGDEEVGSLGPRLAGVILCQELPHLSHLGVRARQEKVVFAMCDDEDYLASQVRRLVGQQVTLAVEPGAVKLSQGGSGSAAGAASQKAALNGGNGVPVTSAGQVVRTQRLELIPLSKATVETCGSKATKCGDLERLVQSAGSSSMFTTPPGLVLPFGSMEVALESNGLMKEFQACLAALSQPNLSVSDLDARCDAIQGVLSQVQLPDKLLQSVSMSFASNALLAVRSSANVEDLAGMSAAGLYESKVGVPASDAEAVRQAVTAVWSSLFSRRAVLSRRAAGLLDGSQASMAVIVMELVSPDTSFVLHTARPSDGNAGIMMAELAPGQGETLASGTRGSPWRLEVDKSTGQVFTKAFANFSRALMSPAKLGPGAMRAIGLKYQTFDELQAGGAVAANKPRQTGLVEIEVDYSRERLSVDQAYRTQVAKMLCDVGKAIESSCGGQAQDIEGGIVAGGAPGSPTDVKVYIFQTRPQH